MKVIFKIEKGLWEEILTHLSQSNPVAYEQVGFLSCGAVLSKDNTLVILARRYHPVSNNHYLADSTVGACINTDAIITALQVSLSGKCSMFHVHLHPHKGQPEFSKVDYDSNHKLIPDFFSVTSHMPHGAVVLSFNRGKGMVWLSKYDAPVSINEFMVVGAPMKTWQISSPPRKKSIRDFSRQESFLGPESSEILSRIKVGIVGLGGGGSHVVQQLAHIGVKRYTICDPDKVENSNLNRLVGATVNDVRHKHLKTRAATRVIKSLVSDAQINVVDKKWSSGLAYLTDCSVIFGCVDTLKVRDELERFCRRNLIPYIDIGMVVRKNDDGFFRISGQVALSISESSCLRCMGILNEEDIKEEAQSYGDAGGQPQVVWSNGLLASSAVGIFMSLICPWSSEPANILYEYSGNEHTLISSLKCKYINKSKCPHYTCADIGNPFFNLKKFFPMKKTCTIGMRSIIQKIKDYYARNNRTIKVLDERS